MGHSTVPDAVDALLVIFTTLYDGTAVVFDGTVKKSLQSGDDWVSVGGFPEPVVARTSEWAGLGTQRRRESYNVRCYFRASGGSDQAALRRRAYGLLATFEDYLTTGTQATLTDTVSVAHVTEDELIQTQADDDLTKGLYAMVAASVHCTVNVF